jgi:hypothetical protein
MRRMGWLKDIGLGAAGGAASGSALIAGFLIMRAHYRGATDGEWLNFAGVIVGVGLTVAVAKGISMIEHATRVAQKKRDFLNQLRRIVNALDVVSASPDELLVQRCTGIQIVWKTVREQALQLEDIGDGMIGQIAILRDVLDQSLANLAATAIAGQTAQTRVMAKQFTVDPMIVIKEMTNPRPTSRVVPLNRDQKTEA